MGEYNAGTRAPAASDDTETDGEGELIACTIPAHLAGARLDQALAELLPDYSRSRLSQWIKAGRVLVAGAPWRPRDKVLGGEAVTVDVEAETVVALVPQPLPLTLVHEDPDILVINKPAGLVVHPAAGNPDGTLANGLLHAYPELEQVPRAGIVHRLDKDTTGLMVVARSQRAHTSLVAQLQAHSVSREYRAVAVGGIIAGGTIDVPIGRHPVDRKRMAVNPSGKPAITHFRVLERFRGHTLLKVNLETGRTHQIRVHLAHMGHPLVGDPVYGGRLRLPGGAGEELIATLRGFRRQALHAGRLELVHPGSGEHRSWTAALPEDLTALVDTLRRDYQRWLDADDDFEDFLDDDKD